MSLYFCEDKLPDKDKFYSKLNMDGVSDKDYEHACKVWKEFGIKNMGEYHDLYLLTDVILLANVFELFRDVCMNNYGLDPAHFYTAPGLAWKACLKKTGIRLELLQDIDMLLMCRTWNSRRNNAINSSICIHEQSIYGGI